MRSSLLDFTRGSQVAETVTMMFGTALKPMLMTALAIILGVIAWNLWQHTETGDSYYWIMHSYAAVWRYFEFNPKHLVGLKTETLGTVTVPLDAVALYPPLIAAWHRLVEALLGGLKVGAVVGTPLSVISTFYLRRFGRSLTERTHKRGAMLASKNQLIAEVDAYNLDIGGPERDADTARILGPKWRLKAPFVSRDALVAAGMYEPYRIAGVSYPWRAEQSHTMLVGTTGTGKSTAMKDILRQVRERQGRAVVFDLTGTFVEGFYDPATDIILNPFDARCPTWSPFADAHTREHFKEASQALVPMSDGGGEQFWPESARMLFVETCVRLVEQGRGNNQALSDVLMTSKLSDLHRHVLKTVAAPLTDPEAKRMAESIRATFNTYAQALMTLPAGGPEYSIRDWVLATDNQPENLAERTGSILFVAAQHVNLRSVRVLLTMWLSTAINTLMSMPGDQRDIRLWFMLDEIGALHNIPAIVSGMQTSRNYGGAFVLGVHTMAQLRETYGDNVAETVSSLAKTKLLMNTRDRQTQDWESAQVGDGEWTEMEENWSYGASNVRDAATLQKKVKLEPLVINSEFAELPDLYGYLKFPQGLPAALVKLNYVKYPKLTKGFIERIIAPLDPNQLPAPPVTPSPGDPEDGPAPAPPKDGEPTEDGTTTDPSGEGFQVATATGAPPERSLLATAEVTSFEDFKARRELAEPGLDIGLDPRFAPVGSTGDTGAGTAANAADRREGGNEENTGSASRASGRQAETEAESIAVQEQKQYFGEREKDHEHTSDAGVDDDYGAPDL
jgi:type IV conjugative transfer system coupling protein TraD